MRELRRGHTNRNNRSLLRLLTHYVHHRSVPEIHRELLARNVLISERTVTNLLARYEELVTLHLTDQARLRQLLLTQGFVILALDGLQPDVGHEVLWVLRDCPSGEVLRSLLSASEADLAVLLREVQVSLPVPIRGVVSDGQHSIQKAVQTVLPEVPHQLCHFHYLREAAKPVYEADRHAKKELKKQLRGIRPIERSLEKRTDPEAQAIRGYCLAVRSALTTMLTTFRKVTASYWPGLFHCYDVPDLPRTNNDLEHYFGSARYAKRRATGRKSASLRKLKL
jgi:hypothetical protein